MKIAPSIRGFGTSFRRNAKLAFLGALALSAAATFAACSNGSGSSTGAGAGNTAGSSSGGANSTGGSGPSGGGASGAGTCTSVSACGGSVVGSWTVSSSCQTLSGNMDVAILSLGCSTVPVTGSLATTGSFVVNADGTSADNTRTTGSATFPLSAQCLSVSSVPRPCDAVSDLFKVLGWTSSVCADTNGQCNCSVSVDRPGGIGFVGDQLPVQGNYTTSGNTLTNNDLTYSYCAAGDTLTLTPQMSSLSGSVVLSKGGSAGAGGAPSTGGAGGDGAVAGGGTAGGGTAGAGAGAGGY